MTNRKSFQSWTLEETACILSHLDYCVKYDRDYKDTIQAKLQEVSRKDVVSFRRIKDKLINIAKRVCQRKEVQFSTFLEVGTRYIDTRKLPDNLKTAILHRQISTGEIETEINGQSSVIEFLEQEVTNTANGKRKREQLEPGLDNPTTSDKTTIGNTAYGDLVIEDASRDKISIHESCSSFDSALEQKGSPSAASLTQMIGVMEPNNTLDAENYEDQHLQLQTTIAESIASDETMDDDPTDADFEIACQRRGLADRGKSKAAISLRPTPPQSTAVVIHANKSHGDVCDFCRARKFLCDRGLPCSRCKAKNIPCVRLRVLCQEKDTGQTSKKRSQSSTNLSDDLALESVKKLKLRLSVQTQNSSVRTVQKDDDPHMSLAGPVTRPNKALNVPPESQVVDSVQMEEELLEATQRIWDDKVQPKFDTLWNVLHDLIRQMAMSGKTLVPELEQILKSIRYTFEREPNGQTAMGKLMEDLVAADQEKASYLKMLRDLVGFEQHDKQSFPRAPAQRDVDQEWKALRDGVRSVVGYEVDRPTPTARGFLAAHVEELLSGRIIDQELEERVEDLTEMHRQLSGVQTLMSALFYRLVFATPDPMFDGLQSDILMELYKAAALTEGLAKVRLLDTIGTKLWFANTEFINGTQLRRVATIAERFTRVARFTVRYEAPAIGHFDSTAWARQAIELKKKLTISPMDYRIHFCHPEAEFDASWMHAEDEEGDDVKGLVPPGTRVAICLFPAITQQVAAPFDEDANVTTALVSRKRFFPTYREKMKLDPASVLSKAVVLLEKYEFSVA